MTFFFFPLQVLVEVFSSVFSLDQSVWFRLVCSEVQSYFEVAWPIERNKNPLAPLPVSFVGRRISNPLVGRARSSSNASPPSRLNVGNAGRQRGNSFSDLHVQLFDSTQPSLMVRNRKPPVCKLIIITHLSLKIHELEPWSLSVFMHRVSSMLQLQLAPRLLRAIEHFSGQPFQVFVSDFVAVAPVCKTCSFAQQARAMSLAHNATCQV